MEGRSLTRPHQYAWEDSFAAKLFDVRNNKELVMLRKMGYLSSSSNFLWSFTPFAVAFSSFALFSTISGKPLTSDIVFPAITRECQDLSTRQTDS